MLAWLAARKFGPNGMTICGDTGDPVTIEEDLAMLEKRRRAVQSVLRKDLRAVRRDCLREIENSIRDTKRYFDQTAPLK
jgi:hypothetical protein